MKSKEDLAELEKKNAEYWEKRIASNTWKTYNSLEEKNRELLDFYLDASQKIRTELYTLAEQISKDGILSRTEMYQQQRLQKLEKKYRDIAYELGKQVEKTASDNMMSGFEETYKCVAIGLGKEDFTMPNKKLMEKLMQEKWRGDSFNGRLWKNQKLLAAGLNDILLTGLQKGQTTTEIAIALHNFMGKSFGVCHRLVRTETMHYLNSATLQRYRDTGVEYVQIWAAIDERTCETCGVNGYHGKIYPIDKAPILPFHAHCRCTYLPSTKEAYEEQNAGMLETDIGKNIKEIVSGISIQKKTFEKGLSGVENKDVRKVLKQALDRTTIKRAKGKRSLFSGKDKVLYLSKNASSDTLAHELFHEIDTTYRLTENGFLRENVEKDYRKLQNLAKGYGKSIEEMLYSKYPEAFEEHGDKFTLNIEYRSMSDILNGMSKSEINLGFIHNKEYWEKSGRVEAETFAQFGRVVYQNNQQISSMMKDLFPNSYREAMQTIERMIK